MDHLGSLQLCQRTLFWKEEKEEMPKRNPNFLEMLTCLCKKEAHGDLRKYKGSPEICNIKLVKEKFNSLLVSFFFNSFAPVCR